MERKSHVLIKSGRKTVKLDFMEEIVRKNETWVMAELSLNNRRW